MTREITLKTVSLTLLLTMIGELTLPLKSFALTTGPSQPEVQAFEPVGTTEMVDLFSGDFVYNIPLMDVDGYPINMSYHSGISMEQEASWVGLGWSLNPGEINRSVRGIPDDFNGEVITKKLHIEPERNYRGKVGVEFKSEYAGFDLEKVKIRAGVDLSAYMNFNNYRGVSAGVRAGLIMSVGRGSGRGGGLNFSPSIGVGSQSGVDLDASLSMSYNKNVYTNGTFTGALSAGGGMNSRMGVSHLNLSARGGVSVGGLVLGASGYYNVPIGLQNYVPVITNSSKVVSYNAQIKIGGELFSVFPDWYTGLNYTRTKYEEDGSREAYGYNYLENAPLNHKGILDFVRDKDGFYNSTMSYLPATSLGYDVYTVSGQGTGGSFRPFRNDVGTVYDPYTYSASDNKSVALELGVGNAYELGGDVDWMDNMSRSGPWVTVDFNGEKNAGSLYEKLFYKQAGEMTYNRPAAGNPVFSGPTPLQLTGVYDSNPFENPDGGELQFKHLNTTQNLSGALEYAGMEDQRATRANLFTALKASDARNGLLTYSNSGTNNVIRSYSAPVNPAVEEYDRTSGGSRLNSTSLLQQTQPDGRRYVYGIPAMNNITTEIAYGVQDPFLQPEAKFGGVVEIDQNATPTTSDVTPEKFSSVTTTPGYAHAFLLTEVLSPDYVDITGNGCSDDDLGAFTKFNYRRTSKDYRWRSPAKATNGKFTVQYDPGYISDPDDGKGTVMMGSREQWYVNSIESKTLVAEFYTSPRQDAKGHTDPALVYPTAGIDNNSYKLDSIRLFNKNERLRDGEFATPIKTVIFKYDYSLCPGTPNSDANLGSPKQRGKLTLKAVYIRYGTSDKNLLNPYKFDYRQNPPYSNRNKDRWGTTDLVDGSEFPTVNRAEFPYTSQTPYTAPASGQSADYDPTAYSLTQIQLPSGGTLNVEYEPDDYGFVQDRRAMRMMKLAGVGTGSDFDPANAGTVLYEGDRQYDYVYFKRDRALEFNKGAWADLREIYLEGETHLYYSVNTELRAGAYEPIRGFAKVLEVGRCTGAGSQDYAYVKLDQPSSGGRKFNPLALYAMNFSKWNLSQVLYPGYKTASTLEVLDALRSAFKELGNMSHPLEAFVREGYCRQVDLSKSWLRLQAANLRKKGGGIRVKQLTISDEWQAMSGSSAQQTGLFGKVYDYTIDDVRYGRISSGVASYEPLIGGDENPLRRPAPYTAAENTSLPAIELYQLEPVGENFFPGASVGYSNVRVRSVHADKGKSSMSEEEHAFYTAKDYPIRVQSSPIDNQPFERKGLFEQAIMEHASQGHCIFLNDMHGRPKAKNNYVITSYDKSVPDQPVIKRKRISGIEYHYNEDDQGHLSNQVKAFHMVKENGVYKYRLDNMEIGMESDLTFDSRSNFGKSESIGAAANLNLFAVATLPIALPSLFPSYHKETSVFHSMVGTKIFQQYGILKQIDVFEENSKTTTTENLVYDAESGNVLVSRTTNEFGDNEYSQSIPAYLAYEGMGPAYLNTGFRERPTLFYINRLNDGYFDSDTKAELTVGDELRYRINFTPEEEKLWVMEKRNYSLAEYYGIPNGYTVFYSGDGHDYSIGNNLTWTAATAQGSNDIWRLDLSKTTILPPGNYTVRLVDNTDHGVESQQPFSLNLASTEPARFIRLNNCPKVVEPAPPDPERAVCAPQIDEPPRCLVKVQPRYKLSHAVSSTTPLNWWAQNTPKFPMSMDLEVIRSGRRNMLGAMLQTTTSTTRPGEASGTMSQAHLVSSGIISASAQTFTGKTNRYKDFVPALVPPTVSGSPQPGNVYEGLNDFVTGYTGTYRPEEQLTPFVDRGYSGHSRVDGTYNIGAPAWTVVPPSTVCGQPWKLLTPNLDPAVSGVWKSVSKVTKYDMYGNAVEELDALEIPSTALYGFNKRLPLAVASNARQGSILFEGFEDMQSQLIPEVTVQLFYAVSTATNLAGVASASRVPCGFFSSFLSSNLFIGLVPTPQSGWYVTQSGTASVTTVNAHSGNATMEISGNVTMSIPARHISQTSSTVDPLTVDENVYIYSMWIRKPASTAAPYLVRNNITSVFQPKGYPIDGWQLMEVNAYGALPISLVFPGSMSVDDFRVIPADANAKCFVYDYNHNNRLSAELDANHFATFYEYDAQGQLARVKKETERGILTISENRSALKKPNP